MSTNKSGLKMKIKNNQHLSFSGNREILKHLAQALKDSHSIAFRQMDSHTRTTKTKTESLQSHITQAVEDKSFERFINNAHKHIRLQLKYSKNKTKNLISIANFTDHFGEENSHHVSTHGFSLFEKTLLNTWKASSSKIEESMLLKLHQFIDTIRPKHH